MVRGLQVPSDFCLSLRTKLIHSNLNPNNVSIYLQQSWMYTNDQPQARIKFFVIKIEKLDMYLSGIFSHLMDNSRTFPYSNQYSWEPSQLRYILPSKGHLRLGLREQNLTLKRNRQRKRSEHWKTTCPQKNTPG